MVFKDVDFSYVPEKRILTDISLHAKPGEKIAFVGSTGAGKTTITNLLNRFYEIESGSITYDDIDIKDINKKCASAFFGYCIAGDQSVYGNGSGKYPIQKTGGER